jgi:feruloyl-CoA synthase
MSLFNDMICRTVSDYGSHTAVADRTGRWTYTELGAATSRYAHALAGLGLGRGTRIALYLYNCKEWLAFELGSLRLGAGVIPANQRFNAEELVWILDNSRAHAVAFSPAEAEVITAVHAQRPGLQYLCLNTGGGTAPDWAVDLDALLPTGDVEVPADAAADSDLARIMYTSATTGVPKGVVIDHDHWRHNYLHLLVNVFRGVDEDDAYLAATPLTHMAGGWAYATFLVGGKVVVEEKWAPENFAQICAEERVTLLMMAPTLFVGLLQHLDEHPAELDQVSKLTFKKIMYGASPMPLAVSGKVQAVFGDKLYQFYGFTENIGNGTGMTVASLLPGAHAEKRSSCGRPQLNTWIRVVDEHDNDVKPGEPGEILTKAWRPGGVWDDESASQDLVKGGWVHSGDIGWFDPDGYLTLSDRKHDMIISGGLNVYPAEIENAMYAFPGISECAVVAGSHKYWVETPVAYYVARPGAAIDPEQLRDHLRSALAHFKVPSVYIQVDELPKNASGKVLRRVLREKYAADTARQAQQLA